MEPEGAEPEVKVISSDSEDGPCTFTPSKQHVLARYVLSLLLWGWGGGGGGGGGTGVIAGWARADLEFGNVYTHVPQTTPSLIDHTHQCMVLMPTVC